MEKKGIVVETGVKTVVALRRGGGGASRHWLRPSVRSEQGLPVGRTAQANLILRAAGPHLYLMHSVTGARQP